MKHLLIIFYLSIPFALKAQSTRTIDSLKTVLSKLPAKQSSYQTDTIRVRVLCAIADKFNNPDSTIKYAQQAKDISKRLNWVDGEFESGFRVGNSLSRKNLYYQAIDVYFGILYLSEKHFLKRKEAVALRAIADVYSFLPNFPLAYKYYYASMKIFKDLKDYEEYADTQNNLANTYTDDNQAKKAIFLLKDCLKYLPYIKGEWSEISFYDNLSMAHNSLKEYDIALKYSLKVINKIEHLKYKKDQYEPWKADAMMMTGFLYHKMNKNLVALNYAKMAQRYLPEKGRNSANLNELYYLIYKDNHNYNLSLHHLELFKKAEKERTFVDQNRKIESIKSIHDLEKEKDKVIILNTNLEKESFQKKVGIVGLFIILGFLIFASWSFVNQKKKNKKIEEQKNAIEELNSTLEEKVKDRTNELKMANEELINKNKEISEALYKGQSIERTRVASALHDNLGGSVAALKWMLESVDISNLSEDDKNIFQNALNITSETYLDVRFMSHNFIPEVLAQLGLQNSIKKLCQEITETKRLVIEFEDLTFSEFSHKIELEVYSICLELITNILKHSKATNAHIKMFENDVALEITVSDNGIGISDDKLKGKGLKNIAKRLESIKGMIETNSIPHQKSIFKIKIPLIITAEYMTSQT